MRIALMAIVEEPGEQARLGGQTLAWHQVQSAMVAGCERIICLAQSPSATLAALQRDTERLGATFHAVANPRSLSGLVSAADTLLVLAPGLLPDREWLVEALGGRAGVAVLPADRAVARGYERIDRDRAWAGVLSTRGDAVEALAQLPPDADPIAGLLRIALQRGARAIEVPEAWVDEGRWALLKGQVAARRFEPLWYAQRVPAPGHARPGEILAYRIARALAGRSNLHRRLPMGLGVTSVLLGVAGAIAGYLGHTLGGLSLIVAAVLAGGVGETLARFASAGSGAPEPRWPREVRHASHDLALLAVASSPSEFAGWPAPFAALVLIAAIRLAREEGVTHFDAPFGDRALVFAILSLLAVGGAFAPGMAAIALCALAIRLFTHRRTSLTQV